MAVNYNPWVRSLGRIILVTASCAAIIVLFSHPLGFLASMIIFGVGMLLTKFVHFLFAPGDLASYDGEVVERRNEFPKKKKEKPLTREEQAGKIASAIENLARKGVETDREMPSRILGDVTTRTPGESRLLTPVYTSRTTQPKTDTDPEAERRKEEAEWADMFRAL